MKAIKGLAALTVGAAIVSAGFIWSGAYNIAGDEPHLLVTHKLLETVRERSISARLDDIDVPDLNQAVRITEGGKHYAAMCSGCHLAPGKADTEIRAGLYPKPPNLAEQTHAQGHGAGTLSAARQFWIIKHGIKLTAMPAWGASHDDAAIWGLVAFLQKLPEMTAAEYAACTEGPDEHENEHEHGDGHSKDSAIHSDGREHHEAAEGSLQAAHEHGAGDAPIARVADSHHSEPDTSGNSPVDTGSPGATSSGRYFK